MTSENPQTPHNKHLPYEERPGHTNPESKFLGVLFYIALGLILLAIWYF